jgi:hypothetical protein
VTTPLKLIYGVINQKSSFTSLFHRLPISFPISISLIQILPHRHRGHRAGHPFSLQLTNPRCHAPPVAQPLLSFVGKRHDFPLSCISIGSMARTIEREREDKEGPPSTMGGSIADSLPSCASVGRR